MSTSVIIGDDTGADVCLPFSGNCTLDGTRIVNAGNPDDDVRLDWNEYADGGDVAFRVPMNDDWDDKVASITPTPEGDPTRTAEWLDNYGAFDGSDALNYGAAALDATVGSAWDFSVAGWLRTSNNAFQVLTTKQGAGAATNALAAGLRIALHGDNQFSFMLLDGGQYVTAKTVGLTMADGEWRPFLCMYAGSTTKLMSVYIDSAAAPAATATYNKGPWQGGDDLYMGRRAHSASPAWYTGDLDDLVVWAAVADKDTDWIRTRYENGNVIGSYVGVDGQEISEVSWTGTFGASYGSVYQVYVNDAGVWTQVGGDNPTSPITGLSCVASGSDAVRVHLAPKTDDPQSETPTLGYVRWVQAPHSTVVSPRRIINLRQARAELDCTDTRRIIGVDDARHIIEVE